MKRAAASIVAPVFISASALGRNGYAAPSNRVTMGCIGVGGMGTINLGSFLGLPDVQVVAVCDVDRDHRNGAKEMVEKHYSAESNSGSYKGCDSVEDFRELVFRPDIDVLLIATPDHWHAVQTIMAVHNGKDVYCEKPLSLTVADGRAVVNAVRQTGRILQTGTWRRSRGDCRLACELALNGRLGKVHTIRVGLPEGFNIKDGDYAGVQPSKPVPEGFNYDMWLGPAPWAAYTPGRCHFNFRWILDYSEGYISDWGAHYLDVAQWGNGTDETGPLEIEGWGEFPKSGLYDAAIKHHIEFTYANGVKLICSTDQGQGTRFEGDDGWVHVDYGGSSLGASRPSLLQEPIGAGEIHLEESFDHRRNFIDCVKLRKPPVAHAEIGHRSATLCHLGSIATILGRKLNWDPVAEIFKNDPEANRMLSRAMRSPWRL